MKNLHPDISEAINKSKRDGGVRLSSLDSGTKLYVTTQNRQYIITVLDNKQLIEGHPKYCPNPTEMHLAGSTFGGSMIKSDWIGIGMFMEMYRTLDPRPITTSSIQKIEVVGENFSFELPIHIDG